MARDTIYTLYKTGRTDPTRQNIWGFSSEEQRRAWLNSKSPTVFLNKKYWRVTSSIKIPVRYEDSFDYDYVMRHSYSTVTDLARFLGLSTSQPLPAAT